MVATQQKATEKLTAKAVGREFVRQYYTMLAKEPRFLHRFYGSSSEMMHGNKDDQFPAVGQSKIREKIKSLNFKDCHTKVAQLDAFLTIGNGICIQVAGEISNNQEPLRRFMQTFVLGPQERDGAEPGTSFYVHNDIFRYQDDIFTDDYPPAEPVEIEKYEEDSPLPQDNGDHATQAYYNSAQPVEPVQSAQPIQSVPVPEPEISVPMPEPVHIEPVQSIIPEPEPVVESEPPVLQEDQTEQPAPEPVEMVQQEEPEPVQAEPSVSVPSVVPEVPVSEQVQDEEQQKTTTSAPVQQQQQSNAPMSWAARMRSNTANQSQVAPPPVQTAPSAPVPTQKPIPKQTTPTPQPPSVEASPAPVGGASEEAGFSQVPTQNPRENRNQENRYNRDRNYEREDRPRREFNDDKQQIFVGGLPITMSEGDIREVFSKFGQVKHVRMNTGNTGRPGAGFGFVTFAKEEAAREALQNKDNIFFNKLQLNIEEKKTRERREGGGRGGYGGQPNGNNGKPRDDRNYRSRDGGYNRDGGRGGGRGPRDGNRGRNPKF